MFIIVMVKITADRECGNKLTGSSSLVGQVLQAFIQNQRSFKYLLKKRGIER